MAEFEEYTNEYLVETFSEVLVVDNVLARAAVRDFGNVHEFCATLHDVNPFRERFNETFQITASQNTYTVKQTDRWLEVIAATKNQTGD